jgi:uncharacterized protein
MNATPITQQIREKIDKWNYMKLKSFCTAKETVTRLKRQHTEWEMIIASCTSDKALITRIYRALKKLPPINNTIKKYTTEMNRQLQRMKYKWPLNN